MIEQLSALLPDLVDATVPDATHAHVCTDECPVPCPKIGTTYEYGAVAIPADHLLLDAYVKPNGGRFVVDIPIAAIAAHLSEHDGDAALTYASASAILTAKAAGFPDVTGLQIYLDMWHAAGDLP